MVKIVFNPAIGGLELRDNQYYFEGVPVDSKTTERLEALGITVFNGEIKTGLSLSDEAITQMRIWKIEGSL